MIYVVIGSGGKTTRIHEMATGYRKQGKSVLVCTSTHMLAEADTLFSNDAGEILDRLRKYGYCMAGIPVCGEAPCKIGPLSMETYRTVSEQADITLIEADGSRGLPVKYPNDREPVIYDNVDCIILVVGLWALGMPLSETVHRWEKASICFHKLGLPDSPQQKLTPAHVQALLREGYIYPMKQKGIDKQLRIEPAQDGSLYQRALAGLLNADLDVNLIKEEWFSEKPCLFLCGAGHVSLEVAYLAHRLDFRIVVMDDRAEFANKERFPMAEQIICDSFEKLQEYCIPNAYYVVVTRGHVDDHQCVSAILNMKYAYLGMIGSRKKVALCMQQLAKEQVPQHLLDTIHAPIGLAIGAQTPAEIAVSIMAEIIREKSRISGGTISSELLQTREKGILCVITEKSGSTPRGAGSMMLVTKERVIDTIGGGSIEAAVIRDARHMLSIGQEQTAYVKEYHLNMEEGADLGMVCGGSNLVLSIPV